MAPKKISNQQWAELERAALAARKKAYVPYSHFKVGAALLTTDGEIISGCNVENGSYGLCICAERNAISTAVAQGKRDFVAIAVATGLKNPAEPCGMCLQTMVEFCVDLDMRLINDQGARVQTRLSKLITRPFRFKGAGTAAAGKAK